MRSVFKFFAFTYIASWILWIGSVAVLRGHASQTAGLVVISGTLYLLGVFSPALLALALTAQAHGRAEVLELLQRTVQWSVGVRWYIFAVTYFAVIKLAVAVTLRIATGAWPAFSQTPWFLLVAALLFSTPVQAGEEIGWRGYALPRLSAHMGLPVASIILGVIWACWHLPFFFFSGTDKSGQSFPVYLLLVTALSAAMAWLYWRTNGSLLLTMLMHAAINNSNIVPTPPSTVANPFTLRTSLVAWTTAAWLGICAVYFLVQMRGAKLETGDQASRNVQDVAPAQSPSAA